MHDGTPLPATVSTTGSDLDGCRAILEAKIHQARQQAVHVLEQIEQDQPRDQIVRPSAVLFDPDRASASRLAWATTRGIQAKEQTAGPSSRKEPNSRRTTG